MALSRILGVLSLVGALLLLSNALPFRHGSSRLRGPGAALADLLVDALDRLDGVSILDLATRRNMVLLCHAILLVLLGDAGILGVPARRRRRQQQLVEPTSTATTSVGYYYSAAAPNAITVVPPVVVDHGARRQRRRTRLAVVAEPEREEEQVVVVVATKEIVLVEKQLKTCDSDDHHHLHDHPAAAKIGNTIHDLGRALVVADDGKNGAEDAVEEAEPAHQVAEEEEEEDVDEMNRRFEAFIAATKEKMRLEALHPAVHVSSSLPQNRALLAR